MRHRELIAAPFVLALVVTLAGGAVNSIEATGRIIDDSTGQPVANAGVSLGNRSATSAADGLFDLGVVPRTTTMKVQAPGYAPLTVATSETDIRLQPATFTLQVNEASSNPPKGVPNVQVRNADAVVGTGGPTGSVVVVPYPGVGTQLLLCAQDYKPRRITTKGIFQEVTMVRGENDCPPLVSPTPVPTVGPSQTAPTQPAAPTPTPSP